MSIAQNRRGTIVFLGDIVGQPGRRAALQAMPQIRERLDPAAIIANAENIRNGSGCTPDLYRGLREAGVDAVTLGDHAFRDAKIVPELEAAIHPICRPANLPAKAPGKRWVRIAPGERFPKPIYVFTVLGRIFFPLPADDPFATADAVLASIPEPDSCVIVEAHMEATSEKHALAHYLDGRVAAVVGSHTHVPTADARIFKGGTAYITDVGMCGPYDTVIGRDAAMVVKGMTTAMHVAYEMGEGGERTCGVAIAVDAHSCRATAIERIDIVADRSRAPFR